MPELVCVAKNVCDAPSVFVLEGVEHKIYDDDDVPDEVLIIDLRDEWHVVITITTDPEAIAPGEVLAKSVDVDYDVRSLQWRARNDLRGRFLLQQLTWGEYELLHQPGVV